MNSLPILFSGAMVPPVLAGSKTQTRRAVNPQPQVHKSGWLEGEWLSKPFGGLALPMLQDITMYCPYGAPGDHLWVKETFYAWGRWETRFSAKKGRDEWHFVDMTLECGHRYHYAVDDEKLIVGAKGRGGVTPMWWKRPAIFMPRAASRITLEVTEVRVERLQDISEADALAEGAPPSHPSIDRVSREFGHKDFTRSWYAQLWDEINGPGSWDANPWVWCVSFGRVLAPSTAT